MYTCDVLYYIPLLLIDIIILVHSHLMLTIRNNERAHFNSFNRLKSPDDFKQNGFTDLQKQTYLLLLYIYIYKLKYLIDISA